MNYYPNNFYTNYGYGNPYQTNNLYTQPQQNLNTVNTQPSYSMNLLGKIVDGEEVVKATEIPIGGFGVFPKADLGEIFVKTWNNNGTTQIIKYQPVAANDNQVEDINTLMFEKIKNIEDKLNGLFNQPQNEPLAPSTERRKELNVNAY